MISLIKHNFISEMAYGTNFSYILNEKNVFLSTEYKVLQTYGNNCFLKCMKVIYNGKIQLLYLTESMKPLSTMMEDLDINSFFTIVSNLLSNIIDVKNNGFLSCQNINISFDKIYVDTNTKKVYLVYLPIKEKLYCDYLTFEKELRKKLAEAVKNYPLLQSKKTLHFSDMFEDDILSIDDIALYMEMGAPISKNTLISRIVSEEPQETKLRLVLMNAPMKLEINITKNDFIIGKKAEIVDGVISFNPLISRSHCKIQRYGDTFTIMDLHSANGTFVNMNRLEPNQPYQIKDGDVIRLANSDFQVSIV